MVAAINLCHIIELPCAAAACAGAAPAEHIARRAVSMFLMLNCHDISAAEGADSISH